MNPVDSLGFSMAVSGLVNIVITILGIGFSWWSLQQFRFDLFLKEPKSPQSKTLQIFLSIVMGYLLSRFFIDYLGWSTMLKRLF